RLPQPDAFSRLRVRIPAGLRRRRRLFVACALAATAALAAVALLLTSPWSGPGAITPAEAAAVLLRTKAAVTPRPGWVFHWRLAVSMAAYPGADHYSDGYFEIWQETKRPYRLRVLTTFPDLRRPVETGGILTP